MRGWLKREMVLFYPWKKGRCYFFHELLVFLIFFSFKLVITSAILRGLMFQTTLKKKVFLPVCTMFFPVPWAPLLDCRRRLSRVSPRALPSWSRRFRSSRRWRKPRSGQPTEASRQPPNVRWNQTCPHLWENKRPGTAMPIPLTDEAFNWMAMW